MLPEPLDQPAIPEPLDQQAIPEPLDLLVLVDASGSMGDPVAGTTRTKWELAGDALSAFVQDRLVGR